MSKQVVEYGGIPVGITVPEGGRLKFIAVKYPVIDLDGGYYSDIGELQIAIRNHLEDSMTENELIAPKGGRGVVASTARNAFNAA